MPQSIPPGQQHPMASLFTLQAGLRFWHDLRPGESSVLLWKDPPFLMGKSTNCLWPFSIAFCMFTRGYWVYPWICRVSIFLTQIREDRLDNSKQNISNVHEIWWDPPLWSFLKRVVTKPLSRLVVTGTWTLFSHSVGNGKSSQLTIRPSFFRGVGGSTTNQLSLLGKETSSDIFPRGEVLRWRARRETWQPLRSWRKCPLSNWVWGSYPDFLVMAWSMNPAHLINPGINRSTGVWTFRGTGVMMGYVQPSTINHRVHKSIGAGSTVDFTATIPYCDASLKLGMI